MPYPFVPALYRLGPLRRYPPLALVIHMAEGGGTVGYLSRANPNRVSVHYVIERSGRIVRMLRDDEASGSINPRDIRRDDGPEPYGRTAAVAVLGRWADDPNAAVLSVEVEGFAAAGPNAAQQMALGELVGDLRARFPDIALLGHRDFADYKACPGRRIPWDALGGHGKPTGEDMGVEVRAIEGVKVRAGVLLITQDTEAIALHDGTRDPVRAPATRVALGPYERVWDGARGYVVTEPSVPSWVPEPADPADFSAYGAVPTPTVRRLVVAVDGTTVLDRAV